MTVVQGGRAAGYRSASGLADVVDTILDKGIVIDAYIRVSLVGIELLTIDIRIVVASVDTYLRFAKAVNRLDLTQTGSQKTLPEMVQDMTEGGGKSVAKGATHGVLDAAKEKLSGLTGESEEEPEEERETVPRPRRRKER
ncbi:gas vesicle protein GvpJ [Streptosporangium amethystogenes]|uniref:gas vesicle protein GvpJ n=1 Tax=Streptosporangium amethystogenes TaxID=2002 RepID=UPI0004C88A9F|nr:gas vesicle protein GvpJ [Streptosporangium amethystogenes]